VAADRNRAVRPWWRRAAVRWGVGYVALRVAIVIAFRARNRVLLDAIRHANKWWLNPLMLRLAGRRHWYAARLEHVGRRSGRRYATPVVAQPVRRGFAIPLPYGTEVDWLRNVRARGAAELLVDGVAYHVTEPEIVPTSALGDEITPLYRWASRQYGIREWLVVGASSAAASRPLAEEPAARPGRPRRSVMDADPPAGRPAPARPTRPPAAGRSWRRAGRRPAAPR
jgi:hypothetical protein